MVQAHAGKIQKIRKSSLEYIENMYSINSSLILWDAARPKTP